MLTRRQSAFEFLLGLPAELRLTRRLPLRTTGRFRNDAMRSPSDTRRLRSERVSLAWDGRWQMAQNS